MKNKLEVKDSNIHGKGLFSTVFIAEGTTIGYCDTRKVKQPSEHTLWVENTLFEIKCCLKYINHHSKPNVAYYDDLSVVALKDIHPGDELTHHYGESWA